MRLNIYTKPGAKHEGLAWDGERIVARVATAPKDGEANRRLIMLLAGWLKLPKSQFRIVGGQTARYKIIDINSEPQVVAEAINRLEQLPRQDRLL